MFWRILPKCFPSTFSRQEPTQEKGRFREYWMIYRGPGFLAVVWIGFIPTPSVSKLDRRQTARLRKRDNLLTGDRKGGGAGGAKLHDGENVWGSSINNSIPSGWVVLLSSFCGKQQTPWNKLAWGYFVLDYCAENAHPMKTHWPEVIFVFRKWALDSCAENANAMKQTDQKLFFVFMKWALDSRKRKLHETNWPQVFCV